MEKREPLCHVGEKVNWYDHYGKLEVPQKISQVELSYDPAVHFGVFF